MSEHSLIPRPEEMKALEGMAKYANDSKFFSNMGGMGGILSIMMYAREIGINPMQALFGGMHNIQGKIELSSRLMNSLIRKLGHRLDITESTNTKCVIKGTRKDTGETCIVDFSIQEAKTAGLYKEGGGWSKYPSDMLFARCLSRLCRRLFPDIIGTAYIEGEVSDNNPPPAAPQLQEVELAEEEKIVALPVDLIQLAVTLTEHIDIPEREYLMDYLEHVQSIVPKPMDEVIDVWLQKQDAFLNHYGKWVQKRKEIEKNNSNTDNRAVND